MLEEMMITGGNVAGSMAGALFFYTVGAGMGFAYSCTRNGRALSDGIRDAWEERKAVRKQNQVFLTRRAR